MMAVDTSALMSIVLDEPEARACIEALASEDRLLISAATVAEALIVAGCRGVGSEMTRLIDGVGFEVVAVSAQTANRLAAAYLTWGKGRHPAGLNFGDCFSYDVARTHDCRLLFVGQDFSKTDIANAL